LQHCSAIAAATDILVSVDFENGFSDNPETTANNIIALAETGVAGCSMLPMKCYTTTPSVGL
jgi:2-methylisocitrate lyase-like PEP mutase family enzyme